MKERPIIFSAEMVKAILDGRKTQTRRVIKPDIYNDFDLERDGSLEVMAIENNNGDSVPIVDFCPYGKPGDQLWVRETCRLFPTGGIVNSVKNPYQQTIMYKAGNGIKTVTNPPVGNKIGFHRWTPSIHMPRWASRIQLEVTGVRVQRVQDISEEDAIAEGITPIAPGYEDIMWSQFVTENKIATTREPIEAFEILWDSINAKRGHIWASNPWVWVIEFEATEH